MRGYGQRRRQRGRGPRRRQRGRGIGSTIFSIGKEIAKKIAPVAKDAAISVGKSALKGARDRGTATALNMITGLARPAYTGMKRRRRRRRGRLSPAQ